MKCLILGGKGFIGRSLCEALVSAGHTVRVFDLASSSAEAEWLKTNSVTFYPGDFTDPGSLDTCLDGVDIIFHLISATNPKTSNEAPVRDLHANVASTLHLLDQIISLVRRPKLIFFSSGGTVYGVPREIPIPEEHPNNPLCAYGVGKLAIEKYLALYRHLHGLDYQILRLANPYGKYQLLDSGQGVVPAFLSHALRGEPLEIWGDGTVVRDYLHIDDVCVAALKVMDYDGPERIFNIGGGQGASLNELIEMIRQLVGQPVSCRYLAGRACDVPVNILNISRAASFLEWQPQVSLREGMQQLLVSLKGC